MDQYAADRLAERAAEDAWLIAAEAGNPDTWAEEEADRARDLDGFGPVPGFW